MNDLDRHLGSGRDAPVPSDLVDKIQASINGAIDSAPTSPAETTPPTGEAVVVGGGGPGWLAWAAALLVVGVLVAVLVPSDDADRRTDGGRSDAVVGGTGGGSGSSGGRNASERADRDAAAASLAAMTEDVPVVEETTDEPTTVDVTAEGITVAGRVTDDRGAGIANAAVTIDARLLREWSRSFRFTGTTDAEGAYAIELTFPSPEVTLETPELPPGSLQRRRTADPVAHDAESLDRARVEQWERAVKQQEQEIVQRKLDMADRLAQLEEQAARVAAAEQRLVASEQPKQVWDATGVDVAVQQRLADELEELAQIEALLEVQRVENLERVSKKLRESLTIRASADAFQPCDPVVIDFPSGPEVTVDLVLLPAEPLEGILVDVAGTPVPGAEVRAVASLDGAPLPTSAVTTLTDDDGRFRLGQIPPGTHLISAEGAGIEPVTAWIDTGPEPVEIVAARAGVVRCTVIDSAGSPIPGARIEWIRDRVSIANAVSGKTGTAIVERITPGRALVRIYHRNHTYPVLESPVDIAIGEQEFEFAVPDAVTVTGTLTVPPEFSNEDGTLPDGGFLVAAYRTGGLLGSARGSYAVVESDGSFVVADVPPGHYVFAIARRSPRGSMTIRSFQDVTLRGGDESLRLHYVDTELATIEVSVRDRSGEPVPGARIDFVRQRTNGRSTHRSGKDGEFSIDIHPSPFDLVISADGYESTRVTVRGREGGTEVVPIVLERRVTLEEAVLTVMRSGGAVVTHGPMTARAAFEALALLEPGAIEVDPALAASDALDRWTVPGKGVVAGSKLLHGLLDREELSWTLEGARLRITFGAGLDERN